MISGVILVKSETEASACARLKTTHLYLYLYILYIITSTLTDKETYRQTDRLTDTQSHKHSHQEIHLYPYSQIRQTGRQLGRQLGRRLWNTRLVINDAALIERGWVTEWNDLCLYLYFCLLQLFAACQERDSSSVKNDYHIIAMIGAGKASNKNQRVGKDF